MEISLIISTFNRKHLLIPLLYILEKQTLKNFEVIVADDGSTDGTVEEVQKIADNLSYDLQIVTQENMGFRVASSRNNGARAARSRQLVFMDDDCRPDEIFLESYHSAFSEKHLLRGDIIFVPSFEKQEHVLFIYPANPETGLWGANFSLAADLFWKVGAYEESFINRSGEDSDLQLRLWRSGIDTIAVKGAHVYHLGRPGWQKLVLKR